MKIKTVYYLVFFALFIRVLFAFFPGFKIDMDDWAGWSARLSQFDFANFYSKDFFSDYAPGYLYVLSILGFLKNVFFIQDNFYFILKMPGIIAEIIIGILLFREVKKNFGEKNALIASSLIFFNPVLIFNSSIWGQIDSILGLLILVCIIGLKNNYLVLSSAFFGLALITKPQAIAIAPVYFLSLVTDYKFSKLLKLTLPALFVIFTLSYPFFPRQTLFNLAQHVLNAANIYPYTSVNAYNLWGVVGFWVKDNIAWQSLSYRDIGIVLFAAYWMVISFFFIKRRLSLFVLASLATLGFYFLPTRAHERYLYPAFILLFMTMPFLRSKILFTLISLLALLHLLNLYMVYVYYNEVYFGMPKLFYNSFIYGFSSQSSKFLSLISFIIFILISIILIKTNVNTKKS